MKIIFRKIKTYFYKSPILATLIVGVIGSFLITLITNVFKVIKDMKNINVAEILPLQILSFLMLLPIILTIQNITFLFTKPKTKEKERAIKLWEVIAIVIGSVFSFFNLAITDIVFAQWHVQLYNTQKHTPIEIQSLWTIVIITLVAITGYIILRFTSIAKLPPLFTVICISTLYLGIAECILWCIQIFNPSNLTMLTLGVLPFNCILIAIRTIRDVVYQQTDRNETTSYKFKGLGRLLNNTSNWPWLAFIAAIPLLGIIVAVLLLFGQEPDSFIKAWTETADWTMSQRVAPQNIPHDGHYLCTVAAGGHKAIVKPIRTGKRHGHRVVVNRQLCIANAFEQLLEEQTPNFHRFVRGLYDKTGYPIAKHINSPYVADVIYYVMKPLEWIFLITLYLFDLKPENRIAVQYLHSPLPNERMK